MSTCYKCSKDLPPEKPSRADTCGTCNAYVRCCRNCRFFAAPSDCREPQAEWVPDREKANFCDFFQLTGSLVAPSSPAAPRKDTFSDLFKK